MDKERPEAQADLRLVVARRPRVLLVDGDLGRRATLAVALGTRYSVYTAGRADEAQQCVAQRAFDAAVLDSALLERALPALVRLLRKRSRTVSLLVAAGPRDLRGCHYAATLGVSGRVGRRAPAHAIVDRIGGLLEREDRPVPFDRSVGRAIDLMARDVTHLLDLHALAEATGVSLSTLAERFPRATGLSLSDYVTRVRVTVAQHLVRDTDLSMTILAELLGFADAEELARAAGLR